MNIDIETEQNFNCLQQNTRKSITNIGFLRLFHGRVLPRHKDSSFVHGKTIPELGWFPQLGGGGSQFVKKEARWGQAGEWFLSLHFSFPLVSVAIIIEQKYF